MGNRFGRQKRRKMREAVTVAEQRAVSAERHAEINQELMYHADRLLKVVADRVPDNSALLPIKNMAVSEYNMRCGSIRILLYNHGVSSLPCDPAEQRAVSYSVAEAHILRGDLDFREFEGAVHARVNLPDGYACYAMSIDSLRYVSPQHAAREMALHLERYFEQQLRSVQS